MKYNGMVAAASWILVAAGLVIGYEAFANANLINTIFGSAAPIVNGIIGIAAVYKLYFMLNKKK